MTLYATGMFQRNGRSYTYELHHDADMGAPWTEHDGHGAVRVVHQHDFHKRPGEIVMHTSRWNAWLYDFQGTIAKAKAEGWGLSNDEEASLVQSLGRMPTRKEIVQRAVVDDLKHLTGWLTDEWHWCWLKVEHESGIFETLGGLESNDDNYIKECCNDLADQIAVLLDDAMAAEITASRPDMTGEIRC